MASPALTGTPTVPTAAVDTNTTQAASTAFVLAQAASATPLGAGTAAVGTSTRFARGDHVHPTDATRAADSLVVHLAGTETVTGAKTFSVLPALPSQVINTVYAGPSSGGSAAPTFRSLVAADIPTIAESQVTNLVSDLAAKAPLASPALTGTPTAPTAAVDTSTTQVATTAFVLAQAASATPLIDGTAAAGISTRYARADHVHPTDSTRAPLASPALTGTPTAPTAAVDTSTTQIASTAYVVGQAASATPLVDGAAAVGTSTRFARADHVHPTDTSRAPLASPALTGTPTMPTAAVDTNTTQGATTAFVLAQAASATPLIDGTAAVGTSTRFARADHVHPTDSTRAADSLVVHLAGVETLTGKKKFQAQAITDVPLVIQGASGQTGNFIEFQDYLGVVLASFQYTGSFQCPTFQTIGSNSGYYMMRRDTLASEWIMVSFGGNYEVYNLTTGAIRFSVQPNGAWSGSMDTVTYAGTISIDVTKGNLKSITTVHATGNSTVNASGVGKADQEMKLLFIGNSTGGEVITFGTNFRSSGTLTVLANKGHTLIFVSDGTAWWECCRTSNL